MPWIVVADIERGGVFGSVVGTVQLLSPDERALFRGFAINKFRGDLSLFDEGVRILEEKTSAPCLGVFPFASNVHLDAEDSLALDTRRRTTPPAGARIAIVRHPHLSNATDFRLLTWADWIDAPPTTHYDFIVLPGTKNTIDDLIWLWRTGLADWIKTQHDTGTTVVGICGGFQMLGRRVTDPDAIESASGSAEGLSLLPIETVMTQHKRTAAVQATTPAGTAFGAYAIHAGHTSPPSDGPADPFATLSDGSPDGLRRPRVIGTYLHGALESAARLRGDLWCRPAGGSEEGVLRSARGLVRHVRASTCNNSICRS